MKIINLWDLLSKASLDDHRIQNFQSELQKKARYPQQELSIILGEDSWLIHIHSADDSTNELKISIPHSHKESINIRETIEEKKLVTRLAELKL